MDNTNEQQHIKTGPTMYKEEIYNQPLVRDKPHTNISHFKPAEVLPSIKSNTLPKQTKDRKEKSLQVSFDKLFEKLVRYILCFRYLEQRTKISTTANHFTSKFNV